MMLAAAVVLKVRQMTTSFMNALTALLWVPEVLLMLTILPVAGFLALVLPANEYGDAHFIIIAIVSKI